ncbi:MAG: hypothetical protein AAF570_26275 [Bacteroidota bacterium]
MDEEAANATFTHKKLRLYPITANRVFLESHKTMGAYTGLKEALTEKKVKIFERGRGGVAALDHEVIVPDAPLAPDHEPLPTEAPQEPVPMEEIMVEEVVEETVTVIEEEPAPNPSAQQTGEL